MPRTTIDYGIDLGTTNSSIAVADGPDVVVLRNNENYDRTPSAVWIDKGDRLYVGRRAYEQMKSDPKNGFSEFRLAMGTDTVYTFARSGRQLRPEELSAEMLKALVSDASRRRNEDIQAAAITVPAAFVLPQCEATQRAARLAGLRVSPLVQEPVAAAMACGLDRESNRAYWLVYELRSGTFDATVVSVRNGALQIVSHEGDNHLGGTLIDWEIVDQLLVPVLVRTHKLSNFRRGNPKWSSAFAKLKLQVEQAKIQISTEEVVNIAIEYLCNDDQGSPIGFEFDLRRQDFDRLMEPLVSRTINMCRRVLSQKQLGSGDIEKVVLVGGTTQSLYLRQRLADTKEGLGIPLDFSVDPVTILARGAAVFAGTQRLEGVPRFVGSKEFSIELDYRPAGSDPERPVGGRVRPVGGRGDLSGYTIEFVNAEGRPPWSSGTIGLSPDGSFMVTLWAEEGRQNVYLIQLRDREGKRVPTAPEKLTYNPGLAFGDPLLVHSIGVAMPDNTVKILIEKGALLPARGSHIVLTSGETRPGQAGELIRVPVVEGESERRAHRNRLIGTLAIPAAQIKRVVPAGSEIEVTLEVDQSLLVHTKAYIPILDEEFEEICKLAKAEPPREQLAAELDEEKTSLARVRKNAKATGDPKAAERLQRIDGERMIDDAEAALAVYGDDPDAADRCAKRILDLKQAIDDVEDSLEWPVELEHEPVGPELDPVVRGSVRCAGLVELSSYTIEIVNAGIRPPWRSGKICLSAEGRFSARLCADAGRQNVFLIEFRDASGALARTTPDRFTYVHF